MASFQPSRGCALRKIQGSPLLWNCQILGAQHMILYEKSKIFYSLKGKSSVPGSTRLCQSTALQVLSCISIDQDEVKVNTRKWKKSTFSRLDNVAIKRTYSWRARLARSGSQSGHRIRFVLPPHGFSYLIIRGLKIPTRERLRVRDFLNTEYCSCVNQRHFGGKSW